jgi:precorrin-6B methylase 2
MKHHAILGAVVILVFVGNRAQGQGLRTAVVPQGLRNGPQVSTGAAPTSQGSISRHLSDWRSKQQGQSLSGRESGAPLVSPDGAAMKQVHGATAITPSGFSSQMPKTLKPAPCNVAPPLPRNCHPRFRRPRQIVIIEVPRFVTGVATTELIPSSGWAEPGLYDYPPANSGTRAPGQLAPFDPTPQEVVDRMLTLAGVKKGDVVYDLGAGDGRVVIAAAKKYGAKTVGFEIDPGLVKLARENVRNEGVERFVEIRQQDFLTADLSPATVVTLYLSYDGNLALRPQLMRQLKPGARIVSYTFDMGDWQPKIVEAYRDAAGESHALYLWEIGGPVVFSDHRR